MFRYYGFGSTTENELKNEANEVKKGYELVGLSFNIHFFNLIRFDQSASMFQFAFRRVNGISTIPVEFIDCINADNYENLTKLIRLNDAFYSVWEDSPMVYFGRNKLSGKLHSNEDELLELLTRLKTTNPAYYLKRKDYIIRDIEETSNIYRTIDNNSLLGTYIKKIFLRYAGIRFFLTAGSLEYSAALKNYKSGNRIITGEELNLRFSNTDIEISE